MDKSNVKMLPSHSGCYVWKKEDAWGCFVVHYDIVILMNYLHLCQVMIISCAKMRIVFLS